MTGKEVLDAAYTVLAIACTAFNVGYSIKIILGMRRERRELREWRERQAERMRRQPPPRETIMDHGKRLVRLADSGEPVDVCRHECNFCGATVLVCHAHGLIMHTAPKCLPFAEHMARLGLGDGFLMGGIVIGKHDPAGKRVLN